MHIFKSKDSNPPPQKKNHQKIKHTTIVQINFMKINVTLWKYFAQINEDYGT